jgi:hypothetical protein
MALLSRELLKLFGTGHLSGMQVRDLAFAAWTDGWGRGDPLAKKLAKPDSVDMSNMARDIVRAAKQHGLMSTGAMPYMIDLPQNKGQLGIMLPHEVYSGMVNKGGGVVDQWCLEPGAGGPMERLLQEWCSHPDVGIPENERPGVAMIGLHADGVTYSQSIRAGGQKNVVVCSFNVISGRTEDIRLKRQPCWVLQSSRFCSCGCGGYHTYQAIFAAVAWSFGCLAAGRSPTERHDTKA